MIPTWQRVEHLAETLRSVLEQDPGPERMQIEVVDNASEGDQVAAEVARVGGGRVGFSRNERNLGLAGNFNRCVERARGHWVHVLHSDDFVADRFYRTAERVIAENGVEVVAFRCLVVDGASTVQWVMPDLSGLGASGAVWRQFAVGTPVQCAGVVMKREVYERVGGFRPELVYCVDVEMWSRAFYRARTEFRPECLGCFRWHEDHESARLRRGVRDLEELYAVGSMLAANLEWGEGERVLYRRHCHRRAYERAREAARAREGANWWRCQRLVWGESRSWREWLLAGWRLGRTGWDLLRAAGGGAGDGRSRGLSDAAG